MIKEVIHHCGTRIRKGHIIHLYLDNEFEHQGEVLGLVDESHIVLLFFSCLTGLENGSKIVDLHRFNKAEVFDSDAPAKARADELIRDSIRRAEQRRRAV